MNLVSIRIRHTLQGSVIEFRSRLVDDEGRVSRSWGAWQVAYLHPETAKVPSGKQRVRAYVRRRVDNRRGAE